MELFVRNVVEALHVGTGRLIDRGRIIPSRNGNTLEIQEPVYTHFFRPTERVLFAPARDANPFLHFFESLWMLAGRADLAFLVKLTKNFEKYSDDGVLMQGSYGYRWRTHFGFDQIAQVIAELRVRPESRRAVISMWDPVDLAVKPLSTDIPCNTTIYFKIRGGALNMTVCNRSNDMLWGAYGANAVHMSMLQEYIAGHLGIPVGTYTQQSDSFHVYVSGPGGELWQKVRLAHGTRQLWDDPYENKTVGVYPMFANTTPEAWDRDLYKFFELFDLENSIWYSDFYTPFFKLVVTPMWHAFINRDISAAGVIAARDWQKAAIEWLERRAK